MAKKTQLKSEPQDNSELIRAQKMIEGIENSVEALNKLLSAGFDPSIVKQWAIKKQLGPITSWTFAKNQGYKVSKG